MIKKYLIKIAKKLIKATLIWDSNFDLRISFLYIFGFLGALLPFSYSVANKSGFQQKNQFVIFLSKLIRPHLFLAQSLANPLSIAACIWSVLYLFNFGVLGFQREESKKINKYFTSFQKVFFYFNQIFDIWLVNVILELLFKQNQVYCFIASAAFIIILSFRIVITKVRVFFSFASLNYQQNNFYYLLVQLLNMIQILVYSFNNSEWHDYIQFTLSIIVCLVQIYQIILKLPLNNFNILLLQLSTYLLTLIFSFGNILLSTFSSDYIEECQFLIVLLVPFFVKFSTIIKSYLMYRQIKFFEPISGIVHEYFIQQERETQFFNEYFRYQLSDKNKFVLSSQIKVESTQVFLQLHTTQEEKKFIDQMHHLKLQILFQEYYEAYKTIGKLHFKVEFLESIILEIYAQKCQEELKKQIIFINQAQKKNVNIEGFIKVETTSQDLCQALIQCSVKKKEFYESSLRQIGKDQIQNLANNLIIQFEKITQRLENYSKKFPLIRFYRCMAFAKAELCNDILEAIKISSASALPDEVIYTKILTLTEEFQSQKTIYAISDIESQEILKVSPNFSNIFKVRNIIELVPNGIKEHHEFMIQDFLRTGRSILYLNVCQTFYEINDYVQPINMLIDVIIDDNQMKAITIATLPEEEEIILIVDSQNKVASFSKSFQNQINFPESQQHHIKGLDISNLIPNFQLICEITQLQHCELKFLNFDFVQSQFEFQQSNSTIFFENPKESQLRMFWNDKHKLDDYISLCQIKKSKYNFYIINFSYIKNVTKTKFFPKSLKSIVKLNVHLDQDLEEEVNILTPYEQIDLENQNSQKFDLLNTNRIDQTFMLCKYDKGFVPLCSQRQYRPPTVVDLLEKNENQNKSFMQMSISLQQKSKTIYEMQNFTKYSLFEKIKDKKDFFHLQSMLIVALLIHLCLFFCQILIQLLINQDVLNISMDNLSLLKIKYELFQPVESFIVTRYTIINYNTQFSAKQLTQAQLNKYLVFPNSNLNLGFDDVQENQEAILNRLALSDFLSTYHDFYIYKTTDVGEFYNITMRQALSILINYQYTFKAAYKYDGKTVSDSPYIFYSYRNLLTLYNSFDELRKERYDIALETANLQQQRQSNIFILFIITVSLFFLIELYYEYKNNKVIDKFIFLLNYSHPILILKEINRIESYVQTYIKNPENLFSYKFTIEQKEADLVGLCLTNKNHNDSHKKQKFSRKFLNKYHFIALLVQVVVMLSFLLAHNEIMASFFNKFYPTCYFYSQIAELGTNIPTIYAMREVLYYRWRYPFYQNKELNTILNQIVTCLQQVQNMTLYFQDRDINDLLISEEFYNQYYIYQTQNLCPLLPDNFTQKSQNFCNITLGASLTKGLQSSLIYIYSSVASEMEINQFLNKTENTINELEGVFLMSQLIKSINSDLNQDIIQNTNNYHYSLIVISALYIGLLIIAIILVINFLSPSLQKHCYLGKRYLYLVPQAVLYGDDSFERIARGLLQQI